MGISLDYYWNELNPKRMDRIVKAYADKEKERLKEWDYMNFNLGKYIAFAVNDPKKYPSKPFLNSLGKNKVMTAQEMEDMAKVNTILLGGKIIK